MLSGLHSATPAGMVTPAWSRIDTRPHAFLSSSRQLVATLKLTRSRCTSHSGPSKRQGELMHTPKHCALAVGAGSSSSGG